ncbi:MAG: DUF1761 domain-containing protein [Chloroflexi bacterium]|nr:DUF1761 domain-containing protein [Chloroflexota bacterium]
MGFEWGWADIDWIAVVVAIIANMVLGFLWYHKKVLGGMWMDDIGMTDEKMKSGNMMMMMGGMVVMLVISTISLALIIGNIGGELKEGLVVGAIIGFGITAANLLPKYMFQQRPNRLAVLDAANAGVSITLAGLIIGAFNA